MFAVVYRWRVAHEDEGQFMLAWQELTRAMQRSCGSYGCIAVRTVSGSPTPAGQDTPPVVSDLLSEAEARAGVS